MGTSIFMRIVMIIIIPLCAYSSARNNGVVDHEELCRKVGIMPPRFKIPIAVDEHDGVPGVVVPADYLEQVELAASRNPSFVRLSKIAGQAGNDISHVMLEQEEAKRVIRTIHSTVVSQQGSINALCEEISDMRRFNVCCMTGCAAVVCGVVYWGQCRK